MFWVFYCYTSSEEPQQQISFYRLTATPLGPAIPLSPGMPISPWRTRRDVVQRGQKCLHCDYKLLIFYIVKRLSPSNNPPPKKPVRYIQEYLALQRVLALRAFLDRPGVKERGIIKLTCTVLTLLLRLWFQTHNFSFGSLCTGLSLKALKTKKRNIMCISGEALNNWYLTFTQETFDSVSNHSQEDRLVLSLRRYHGVQRHPADTDKAVTLALLRPPSALLI